MFAVDSLGNLSTLWSVEYHPRIKIFAEIFKTVRDARRHKERIALRYSEAI